VTDISSTIFAFQTRCLFALVHFCTYFLRGSIDAPPYRNVSFDIATLTLPSISRVTNQRRFFWERKKRV